MSVRRVLVVQDKAGSSREKPAATPLWVLVQDKLGTMCRYNESCQAPTTGADKCKFLHISASVRAR